MSKQLKSCPFCGSDDIEIRGPSCLLYKAMCCGCGTTGNNEESKAGAVEWWNRRAPVSAPTAVERQSIDTPEFVGLLHRWSYLASAGAKIKAYEKIIAHIDTWAARSAVEAVPQLADGYKSSTMVSDFAGPKITLRYDTTAKAEAAHEVLCELIDGATRAPGNTAPVVQQTTEQHPAEISLGKIRESIIGYYRALNRREHGGVAMNRAFRVIECEMGMGWYLWNNAEAHERDSTNKGAKGEQG